MLETYDRGGGEAHYEMKKWQHSPTTATLIDHGSLDSLWAGVGKVKRKLARAQLT